MERFPDEDRQKRLKLLSLKLQWWSGLELESKLTKATETIWSAHLRHSMRGNLLADNTYLMESSVVLRDTVYKNTWLSIKHYSNV